MRGGRETVDRAVVWKDTSTVGFKVLFVLIVLAHNRRKVVHFNGTAHPTAQWTAQQLVAAFPWETAPKYLLRDRDAVYGEWFQRRVTSLGMEQVLTAPRSPWQNAAAERVIGSIRRDCLDQVMVFNEGHLRRLLTRDFHYYIIIAGVCISRWPWIALTPARYTRLSTARWSPSRKWVDYINYERMAA